ncbi:hypothetical protein ACH5RR_011022 [Cinchona calisaya]|uniref:Uncharacterized protein n=1 Tax=Cinchona calisaya TaxID=153742 RepID=A0ABD3A3Q4_9GENT
MELFGIVIVLSVILVPSNVLIAKGQKGSDSPSSPCNYPAIYNFGDSNSDTGGTSVALFPRVAPYGETYFHRPAGRATDGRLIIDFIADHLGLPFLSPYLDSLGSNFRHGANFATGGAMIHRPTASWFQTGSSPFPLEIQVEQYIQFKERTAYFYAQGCEKSRIPRPEEFSKALHTFDIGQNDLASGFGSNEALRARLPHIISLYAEQLRGMYEVGARVFWIHNIGPLGCLPLSVIKVENPPPPGYLDEHGCIKSRNDIVKEFNKHLKETVVQLRAELSEAAITFVDIYSVKYRLISNAKKEGFEEPFKICCGIHGTGIDVGCGNTTIINGAQVYGGSCAKPSAVISWDGVHFTDRANTWIATHILDGSFSDPPIPITRACHRHSQI